MQTYAGAECVGQWLVYHKTMV